MGNAPGTGYYLPDFDSVAGHGFQGFIQRRWPRSKIYEKYEGESDEGYYARDKAAEKSYEIWLRNCWQRFLEGDFPLPYNSVKSPAQQYEHWNYPPDDCLLKYPENVGGIFGSDSDLVPFRQWFNPQRIHDPDYQWPWAEIERKFPYVEQRDKTNKFTSPLVAEPQDIDVEEQKEQFKDWFRQTWPPAVFVPDFNQSEKQIATSLEEYEKIYDEWVEVNWTKITQFQQSDKYSDWPLPYEGDIFTGEVKNKPVIQMQLKTGYIRTMLLHSKIYGEQNPPRSWTNPNPVVENAVYQKLWVGMYTNFADTLQKFRTASFGMDTIVKDSLHVSVIDSYYDGIGNYTWGLGGKIGRRYPLDFPPAYPSPNVLGPHITPLYYAAMYQWPDPYDMATNLFITPSNMMPFPSIDVLHYWEDLIEEFSKKNPRLMVPRFSIFGTPLEKQNFNTDRIGFKMQSDKAENEGYFYHSTIGMKSVDDRWQEFLPNFDKYLFSFCETVLERIGVFQNPAFTITDEYKIWKRAVLQAVHFRYAERHYFYPWERFVNADSTRNGEWPQPQEIDTLARNIGFKFKWPEWVWADNFLTQDQKTAILAQKTPYDFRPFTSEILPWKTLYYLLKTVQDQRNKQGSAVWLDVRAFDPESIEQFGLFIWHHRRDIENSQDNRIIENNSDLVEFLKKGPGLSFTSSQDTWYKAFSYLLNNMFDTIMNAPTKTELKKIGECVIDPSEKISDQCTIWVEPEEIDDGTGEGELNDRLIVEELWRQQWLATQNMQDWPTYFLDEEGNIVLAVGSQPVPTFWEKFFRTLFPTLKETPSAIGYEPGGAPVSEVIKGFILPKIQGRKYSTEIMKMYKFMRIYGIPVIRKKPPAFELVNQSSWNDQITQQWAAYINWVQANVKAQNHQHYSLPYQYLKNKEGNTVMYEGKELINQFPNFGVFPNRDQTDFNWIFDPGSWTDEVFGVPTSYALLMNFVRGIANIVIKTLKLLIEELPGIVWFLLIAGGIAAGLIVLNKTFDRYSIPSIRDDELAQIAQTKKRRRIEEAQLAEKKPKQLPNIE